jgi:hypothetical protein
MSTPVLVLGESGAGKSTSMRNLDPANTLLIQVIRKPLPFKREGWQVFDPAAGKGNIFQTDHVADIITLMQKTKRKIIVIDDYHYILSNELMRRFRETGYGKFSEIGYNGWNLINVASSLPPDVRVYFMAHTMTGDDGITKIKTPGKLLETYTVEGLFSIVLRSVVRDGEFYFATRNSGSDTVKTPMDMFKDELIPNDLVVVDQAIKDYGWVNDGAVVPTSK